MPEPTRVEEWRRRVEEDPASPLFAQLAEEYRRLGRLGEAVRVCRAGLRHHPDYWSARVTLGRALVGLGDLERAGREFHRVLQAMPQNLAALRALASLHCQAGRWAEAHDVARQAVGFAPDDPDLRELLADLEARIGPPRRPQPAPSAGQPAAGRAGRQIRVLEDWLARIVSDRRGPGRPLGRRA